MINWLYVACSVLLFVCSSGANPSCGNDLQSGCQNSTARVQTTQGLDFSLFDSTLREFLYARGFQGATAAVVHRDYNRVLHVQGYGNRNADHVFLLASVSKIMTASVFSHLQYREKVDIQAPIRSLVPTTPLTGWWARGRLDLLRSDFTIEQALSNLSGMPGLSSPLEFLYGICTLLADYSLQSCGRKLFNVAPQLGAPGTFHRYGGAQWHIAGAVAEYVTGQAWADLVKETFAPCNLGTFGYTNQGLSSFFRQVRYCLGCQGDSFCEGCYDSNWRYDPDAPPNPRNPGIEGGGYGDARSVAKVLLMLLKGGVCENGRIMSPGLARNIVTDRQLPGDTLGLLDRDMGYGMGMYHLRDAPGDVWASPGSYASLPWIDLENGYGAVVLLESDAGVTVFDLLDELSPILRDTFSNTGS